MKARFVIIGTFLSAVCLSIIIAVVWFILAVWVPAQGKNLLIHALEKQAPIDISIDSMHYRPLKGLLLENLTVSESSTKTVWFEARRLALSMSFWSLLIQQDVLFRADGQIITPMETDLRLSGRYHLRTRQLSGHIKTKDAPLATLKPILRQHIPDQINKGNFRIDIDFHMGAEAAASLTGKLTATQLSWIAPTAIARGDATLNGSLAGSFNEPDSWIWNARVRLHNGSVESRSILFPDLADLNGTAHIAHNRLNIEQLTGKLYDKEFQAEGTIEPLDEPAVELFVSSSLELGNISQIIRFLNGWHLAGLGDVNAVCRGPLSPSPTLDCLIHTDLQEVALTGPKLTEPLILSGRVDYDYLPKLFSIPQLEMKWRDVPLSAHGTVALADPSKLDLALNGTINLAFLNAWLPSTAPLNELAGLASLDMTVEGDTASPRAIGQITLRDGQANIGKAAHPLESLEGTINLSSDKAELSKLSMRLADEPLEFSGTISKLWSASRLEGILKFTNGTLKLSGYLEPERAIIESADIALAKSRLQLKGEVSRKSQIPSLFAMQGTVLLEELNQFPFIDLTALKDWPLEGPVTAQVEWSGLIDDWKSASMRARVRAPRIKIKEIPIEDALLDFEQAERVLRLRIPQAHLADGTFWNETIIQYQPDSTSSYVTQLELTGIQLAGLAKAIPKLKERSILGMASARILLSGTWQKRAGWDGEGWFNASGKHLGDMPMLDKLFQGLFGVLSDRLVLDSLKRAQITQISLQWQLSDERFRTEDLRISGLAGTEPVAIYAKGSVGFDQTLDFIIEPELSEGTILEAPTTSTPAQAILKTAGKLEHLRHLIGRHRLLGTIKDPEYRFELTPQEVFRQVAPGPANILDGILNAIR